MYDFDFRDADVPATATTPMKPKNRFITENGDAKTITAEFEKVKKIVKDNPTKTYLIICLYAGHGQIVDSKQ